MAGNERARRDDPDPRAAQDRQPGDPRTAQARHGGPLIVMVCAVLAIAVVVVGAIWADGVHYGDATPAPAVAQEGDR